MTTATMVQSKQTVVAQPRPGLEELVDRVIAALFPEQETTAQSVARTVHDARRLRKTGWRPRRRPGGLRRRGHGEGGVQRGPLGLLRVVPAGEATVR